MKRAKTPWAYSDWYKKELAWDRAFERKIDFNDLRRVELYARWLAEKQGIDLAGATSFHFYRNEQGWATVARFFKPNGYFPNRRAAREQVAEIAIPHCNFNPAAQELAA